MNLAKFRINLQQENRKTESEEKHRRHNNKTEPVTF